ncbi:uncharacterized protein LOC111373186 [Olea europaea var. sylvestris]|uniref:uncharacterized protein LOC111373186 n=1 Tax=Olea europaea var. sylvestris TaxID=158386 RepID=UPI000C1D109A|nr:uncharacterized protein LOC111373186 [Olea europaea var. sylvestris]
MCVDYTGLNKVCPKDSYPLPRIDQLVDATSGHERLSFLDAFLGYHQILMAEADQEKTSFITDFGTYCYTAMPFGLKNAGATYQRMVNKVFRGLIRGVVEVYVDDMVVKSARANDHVACLQKVFDVARQNRLRFNPEKCVFGTAGGKFLGFMITQRGIEVNPDKIRAILEMKSPTSRKEVQRLTGRVAALNRFMSQAADKCYHFFKAIGGSSDFEWTQECEESLRNLKQSLQEPPVLTSPSPGDVLCLYLAVSPKAVSAVLVKEFSKAQKPVYYVSQVLRGAEIRYSLTEQLVFALIVTVRKLRPYFQSHTVQVMTDQPIKQILHRPETSGRLLKWAIELSEFDIEFRPRTAIKAQALADFIVELTTPPELPLGEQADWKIFVDGSSNDEGSGAGIIMIGLNEEELEYSLHFEFPATNNEVEYEAVITGLGLAARLGVTSVEICSDSQLIIGQVTGEFEAKDGKMAAYLMEVKNLQKGFAKFKITKVPRKDNERADALAKLASANPRRLPRTASVQILRQPSIQHIINVMNVENEESWIDPLFEYLTKNKLSEDALTARRLKVRAASFAIIDGQLYKRGFTMPYLKCLRPTEAQEVLVEVYAGICGNHQGATTLAFKTLRQGYYWPSIKEDARDRATDGSFRGVSLLPMGDGHLGTFALSKGQRKFLLVAVDYFTKWVEAEPLATITTAKIQGFVWKNIICRFGILRVIITDNGKQFDNHSFRAFCTSYHIDHRLTSVAHSQANGQAEVTNRTILWDLKTRLEKEKGLWAEELPNVLWAYHTTPRESTGETPFKLAFGMEAVVPVEILSETGRMKVKQPDDAATRGELDLLEGVRDKAAIRMMAYKRREAEYFNRRVKPRVFQPGDLVLRDAAAAGDPPPKLGPNWEGPYKVIRRLGKGAYSLKDIKGRPLGRPWNAEHLKKYYQ